MRPPAAFTSREGIMGGMMEPEIKKLGRILVTGGTALLGRHLSSSANAEGMATSPKGKNGVLGRGEAGEEHKWRPFGWPPGLGSSLARDGRSCYSEWSCTAFPRTWTCGRSTVTT
jgi:hypothetical protein